MEIRNAVLLTGIGLTLSVLGLSLYEVMQHDLAQQDALYAVTRRPQAQEETRPVSAEEAIAAVLPSLSGEDELSVRAAVEQVRAAYDGPGAAEIPEALREQLAVSLTGIYGRVGEEIPEDRQLKDEIMRLVAVKVGGAAARDFTAALLDSTTESVRLGALEAVGATGAVRGGAVTEKALALARSEDVPDELKPAVLRRFLGRKAEPEIQALFESELSPAALKACAVALQDFHKPELMKGILSRLQAAGLLNDHRRMPWLSGRLLSEHIKTASSEELALAVQIIKARPTLTRATMKAFKTRLSDKEPGVRRMVAQLIPSAVGTKDLEVEDGESMLVAQLQTEEDPAVKGAIEEGLSRMRLARQPQPEAAAPSTP